MRWPAVLAVALFRLRQRPVRTLLLLQGTIWGVAVAIFPSAVILGTREAARTQGARLGADRITVCADPTAADGVRLEPSDVPLAAAALARGGRHVRAVGGLRVARTLPGADGHGDLTLLEALPGTGIARGLRLAAGRWLRADDPPGRCVVEAGVAAALGRGVLRPGDRLRLPGRREPLEVVGVSAPRPAQVLRTNDLGFDLGHPLYARIGAPFLWAMGIPLVQDAWKRSERCIYVRRPDGAGAPLDWLFVRVAPREVSAAARTLRRTFTDHGKAVVTLYPLVLPVVMGQEVERFGAVNVAMFLACLVMGAVVMLNLGLLSTMTRAREIAIRRTEGATRRAIAVQFLAEGAVLSAVGAGLGCLLGMLLADLRASLEPVTGFTWTFPVVEAAWAVGVALVVGVAASLLPALRAARQDPVRGLADE
jgi:hypothetical protein